ncbi:MAG: trypsin-like peptidase domain-containing protein [Bifidobacteriaceae bacterium]|jgi:putative serine protease PepD|nr:trypsin-like peptidase domain-containing protein [Bifidobacteriaceae bacterium]
MTDQPQPPFGANPPEPEEPRDPLPAPAWRRTDEPPRQAGPARGAGGDPEAVDGPGGAVDEPPASRPAQGADLPPLPASLAPEPRQAPWRAKDDSEWDASWGGAAAPLAPAEAPRSESQRSAAPAGRDLAGGTAPSAGEPAAPGAGFAPPAGPGADANPPARPWTPVTGSPAAPAAWAPPAAALGGSAAGSPDGSAWRSGADSVLPAPASRSGAEGAPAEPAPGSWFQRFAPRPPDAVETAAAGQSAEPAAGLPGGPGAPAGPAGAPAAFGPARESLAWQASGQPTAGPVAASTNPPLPPRTASPYQAPPYALSSGPGAPGGPSAPPGPLGAGAAGEPGAPGGPAAPAGYQSILEPPESQTSAAQGRVGKPKKMVTRGGAWGIGLVAGLVTAGLVVGAAYTLDGLTGSPAPATSPTQGAQSSPDSPNSGQNTPEIPSTASDGDQPDWSVVAAAVQPTVVAIQISQGQFGTAQGSGVIVNSAKGYVVTNNHVIADGGQIQIVLADGSILSAEVLGADASTDLAVLALRNPPANLKEAELGDSSQVVVGEPVMAVGNPLGLDNTVTTGIVSALNRPVENEASGQDAAGMSVTTNAIQVDAAVNPGNSGGPLFNAKGQVIGINSSIATLGDYGGTSGDIGLAFAIPSNQVSNVVTQLIENGVATHPFLGVSAGNAIVEVDGVNRAGAEIANVTPGTPALEAGLSAGDVIIAVDGHSLTGSTSLTAWIRSYRPGDQVTLTVVRGGQVSDIQATLTTREDS